MSHSVLSYEQLRKAVTGTAAAFRSVTKLQPAVGQEGKIFPATYSQGKYLTEKRRLSPGAEPVDCVLMASVQACANIGEEALLDAVRSGRIELPLIEVDFEDLNPSLRKPFERITSLQAPHRLADAILRDSVLPDGTRFSSSEYASAWGKANTWNATPIYKLAPHALVFGLWGSPKKPGGLGAKFERTIVSEIVAIDAIRVDGREGFRIDPCGASRAVKVLPKDDGSFEVVGDSRKEVKGSVRPSEINHGNVLWPSTKSVGPTNAGIRCRFIELSTVISLPALRRLKFPLDGNKQSDPAVDELARSVLAAIGLCSATLAAERGLDLRSRCLLHEEEPRVWELIDKPGSTPEKLIFDAHNATALLRDALTSAEKAGLRWQKEPIVLKPSKEFGELIRLSQEREVAEEGEGDSK
jgi:CRISPR-associated protein Csb1